MFLSRTAFHIVALSAALTIATTSLATSISGVNSSNGQLHVPDRYQLAMLIHSTVAALDHANRTGNYAVLREMSAPAFQRANSAARLSLIFSQLRQSRLSLAPAILFDPMLSQAARIDGSGYLRLTGFFPTQPIRVHFDMRFQSVAGEWRLFGITIQPRTIQSTQPPPES